MSQKSLNLTALLILTFLLLNLSCCDDCKCPTCPEPELEKAYYVYIADDESADPNYIWIVNSKTDSLFDSIQVEDGQIWFMRITTDGKYLAIANFSKDSVYIMDTDSREIVGSAPYEYPADFSFDDRYFIVSDFPDSQLYIYEYPGWHLKNVYKVPFFTECLYNKGHRLIGDISWAGKEYAVYDYLNDSIIKTDSLIRPDGSTPQYLELILSPDDEHLYFLSRPNKLFKFNIGQNMLVDSVIIFYGGYYGEMHNSPDEQYLYVSEMGQDFYPMYGILTQIGQSDFTVKRRYNTWGLNPLDPNAPADIGLFEITPNGQKIYGYRSMFTYAPPVSLRIDNGLGSLIHGYPAERSGMALAIGREIK